MLKTKLLCSLLILVFLFSITVPVFAKKDELTVECMYSYLAPLDAKPSAKPVKPSPAVATVNIRNIPSGDYLLGDVLVIAQVTGSFASVKYEIAGLTGDMVRIGVTDRYQAMINTGDSSGPATLIVKALDSSGNQVAFASTAVNVVTSCRYSLTYEIDYVQGFKPDDASLNYLEAYWRSHAVDVTFKLDQEISDTIASDGEITEDDFWTLESIYNDGADNTKDFGYQWILPEKWMLYGSWFEDPRVGGLTYVVSNGREYVAGNYIFIAAGMIDNWEIQNSITDNGGEVIVAGHEAGHSIGIVVGRRSEVYDADYYSIMSYMRLENAKFMNSNWYYSKEYWSAANLNYYPA